MDITIPGECLNHSRVMVSVSRGLARNQGKKEINQVHALIPPQAFCRVPELMFLSPVFLILVFLSSIHFLFLFRSVIMFQESSRCHKVQFKTFCSVSSFKALNFLIPSQLKIN